MKKNIRMFYLNVFQFLEVKFSIYLNRRVFVMALRFWLFLVMWTSSALFRYPYIALCYFRLPVKRIQNFSSDKMFSFYQFV